MEFPKISIVTPSFNKGSYIEKTIQSVLSQGYPNLEYIIIDGKSTDNSIDIVRKYENSLSYWVSEKDDGMYYAIQKGFKNATGEIMGWVNSDDILHPKSLFTIAEMFSTLEEVEWIQGHPTVIDEMDRIVYSRNARNNKLDFYKKKYRDGVFIQQESTFWRKRLWEKAGNYISTEYKYAGDFELWIRFFNYAQLYNTSAIVGAFRFSGEGQITNNYYEAYLAECDAIIDKAIEKQDKQISEQIKEKSLRKFFARKRSNTLNVPGTIEYDFSKKTFRLSKANN